jgi:hypothetical protein
VRLGPKCSDEALLDLGAEYELAQPWADRWPDLEIQ